MIRRSKRRGSLAGYGLRCLSIGTTALMLLPGGELYANSGNDALAVDSITESWQVVNVKGAVVDMSGEPVIGATVKVVGTSSGTITDLDGKFELSIAKDALLEISYIGYATQQVKVERGGALTIKLREETEMLNEVVVTGFGMSQKKATLTGAISTAKSSDIERSSAVTASGALVGKIAGLNTRQQGGAPGATTALQIRNMGTPLFVIDGVVSDEGQFNNMDFNDIESVAVLKDASAALYGVRAANGVIVVTTKI